MPIVRRTYCIKPRVVLAWICWLRLCGVGTRAERTVVEYLHSHSALNSCPDSTQSAASTSRLTPDAVLYSLSPDDGHNDAGNMLSQPIVNKHLHLSIH